MSKNTSRMVATLTCCGILGGCSESASDRFGYVSDPYKGEATSIYTERVKFFSDCITEQQAVAELILGVLVPLVTKVAVDAFSNALKQQAEEQTLLVSSASSTTLLDHGCIVFARGEFAAEHGQFPGFSKAFQARFNRMRLLSAPALYAEFSYSVSGERGGHPVLEIQPISFYKGKSAFPYPSDRLKDGVYIIASQSPVQTEKIGDPRALKTDSTQVIFPFVLGNVEPAKGYEVALAPESGSGPLQWTADPKTKVNFTVGYLQSRSPNQFAQLFYGGWQSVKDDAAKKFSDALLGLLEPAKK